MDDLSTTAPADTSPGGGSSSNGSNIRDEASLDGGEAPTRRPRWLLTALLAPVVLLVILVIAWAVDTSSGEVARNVELSGEAVGGLSEDELAGRVGELAARFAATPVELTVEDTTYETTAGDLGLVVDKEQTAQSALEVGDSSFFPFRPFIWIASLFGERHAPLELRVNADQVAITVLELEGDARVPPTEPSVELVEDELEVVPGEDGVGIDPSAVAEQLPAAAEHAAAGEAGVIDLEISRQPIPPLAGIEEARAAAERAEGLVAEGVEISTEAGSRSIEAAELRSWVRLESNPDGSVEVVLDQAEAADALRQAFADIEGHPRDATFTLDGGTPVIIPDRPGKVCCGGPTAEQILAGLGADNGSVELPLVEGPASFTAADAAAYRIEQPVGGNSAWRDGAPTTAGPGFTTYHSAGGNRVVNIHRMADLVRGAVVAPGGSFSINRHVGQRTTQKGFLPAGAITNGEHVDEIGGGVSQFATTMFNAAYFAGLRIDESQAHSEYFSRYPRGREATMGYPAPDLAFTNNTPYGILIWTSYTDTSLTITLYSTPYARGEQTDLAESTSGNCRIVTTTRTVTFPDGTTTQDKFKATYRPGPGQGC